MLRIGKMRGLNCRTFLIISLILLLIGGLSAKVELNAKVQHGKVGVEDRFNYTVEVKGDDLSNVGTPEVPPLKNFKKLGTKTSSSTNIRMIGSKVKKTITKSYIYTLSPKKVGDFTIPPAKITHDGEKIKSERVKIKVVKGSRRGKTRPRGRRSRQRRKPRSAKEVNKEKIEENLFVSTQLSDREVYVGEQVTVSYWLYTKFRLRDLSLKDSPSAPGFWSEDLHTAKNLNFQKKKVNGKVYKAALLKKIALFPLKAGELKIEPMSLKCVIRTSKRGFFDFFGGLKKVEISGDPQVVEANRLPSQNKPSSFTGGVGNFSISTGIDKSEFKCNQAFTFTIDVEGTGNIASISVPSVQFPPDFEQYDVEEGKKVRTSNNKISGTRKFEYTLLPRSEGEYKINPIKFSYFDPDKEKYVTLTTSATELNVQPGESRQSDSGMRMVSKNEVKSVGSDINFIKPNMNELSSGFAGFIMKSTQKKIIWWLGIEALLILVTIVYQKRREKFRQNTAYARNVRAYKKAKKGLKNLSVDKKGLSDFYSSTNEILMNYIADKLNISSAGIILSEVSSELEDRGISKELIEGIKEKNEFLNLASYSPSKVNRDPQEVKGEIKELIRSLEKEFK